MSPGITFGTNTTPFTVEVWMNTSVGLNGTGCLLGSGGTGTDGFSPYPSAGLTICNTSTTSWKVDSSGTAAQSFTLEEMSVGQWYYFAVTRDTSGYIQMWLGSAASGTATASTSGRQLLNTTNWDLVAPTLLIGAWTNTNRYNQGLLVNNLRVTNTNRFATTATTLAIPSTALTAIAGTQLLINNGEFIDQSANQTLTTVGTPTASTLSPF